MKPVFVRAIGILSPGLSGWQHTKQVLAGHQPYQTEDLPNLQPKMLRPNERRRTSGIIKLALQAVYDALGEQSVHNDFVSVFASAEGDLEIIDRICKALDTQDRPVSPTHFQNSVHNAVAGYCSIASGSTSASTSIAALEGSFSAGMLEACVQAHSNRQPILYVAYDYSAPFPLSERIPISTPFATALLLSADANDTKPQASLKLKLVSGEADSRMTDPQLEQIRLGNPSARSLPLLQSLAIGEPQRVVIPYLPELSLAVEINPC
jgi:hypothetical protein